MLSCESRMFVKENPDKKNLVSIYFDSPRLGHTTKTNFITFQTIDPEISLILNFWKKDLGLVCPPHFVHNVSRKIFLMFYSLNWPNFIVLLLFILEISSKMLIPVACFPVCDVIKFEIHVSFVIKLFSYITKKAEQKFKFFKNKKSF